MRTLRKGCRGSEVKTLQGYLNLIQDGIFGVLTEESVKEFQSSNGLTADGVVCPATWAELIKGTTKHTLLAYTMYAVQIKAERLKTLVQQHNGYIKVIEEKMEAEMRLKREGGER